jgi:uncharacterized protein YcbK (DUF882 family)
MSWSKAEQELAELDWFARTTDRVAAECNGSVISGRRTRARQAKLRAKGLNPHPESLHLVGLAIDHEYDTESDYIKAWEIGRKLGLHGYKKRKTNGIHWQARPMRRRATSGGAT